VIAISSLNPMKETIQEQILTAKQCMGCMHEGFIVTSPDGTITEISPAAERILEAQASPRDLSHG
jgi:PAS domain-containing protein